MSTSLDLNKGSEDSVQEEKEKLMYSRQSSGECASPIRGIERSIDMIDAITNSMNKNNNNNNNNSDASKVESFSNEKIEQIESPTDNTDTKTNSNNNSNNDNSNMENNNNNNDNDNNNNSNNDDTPFDTPQLESSMSKEEFDKLDEESKDLIEYNESKRKRVIDNNGVTFWPSPHLMDDQGNILPESMLKPDTDDDLIAQYPRLARYKNNPKRFKRESLRFKRQLEEEEPFRQMSMESALKFAASSMNCTIEAAFTDRVPNKMANDNNNSNTNDNDSKDDDDDDTVLQSNGYFHNGFIHACEVAWSKHHPLKIDPTHVWLLILHACALHVDMNAELLRSKWVKHDGKKKLVVRRDSFVKGLRNHNDWAGVIDEFNEKIDENAVGGVLETLEGNFSNASDVDKIAVKVVIMDICKNYFKYIVRTRCGFPRVTLTGTQEDWQKIYQKTQKLLSERVESEFGKKWGNALLPILQRFVDAFDANKPIDCLFWNSMIKRGARRGSGGWEWYSGWINVFFPIISNQWNQFCEPYSNTADYIVNGLKRAGAGNDVNKYPAGLASAPVKWEYFNLNYELEFIAGFIGVKENKKNDNELTPIVGWVIGEKDKNQNELENYPDY